MSRSENRRGTYGQDIIRGLPKKHDHKNGGKAITWNKACGEFSIERSAKVFMDAIWAVTEKWVCEF